MLVRFYRWVVVTWCRWVRSVFRLASSVQTLLGMKANDAAKVLTVGSVITMQSILHPTMVIANPEGAAVDAYLAASASNEWLSFAEYRDGVLASGESWEERAEWQTACDDAARAALRG